MNDQSGLCSLPIMVASKDGNASRSFLIRLRGPVTSLGVIIFNGILILKHLSYDAGTTEYTEGELPKYYLVQ
jgi:hypothetical protein